jgi:hypothetical protein
MLPSVNSQVRYWGAWPGCIKNALTVRAFFAILVYAKFCKDFCGAIFKIAQGKNNEIKLGGRMKMSNFEKSTLGVLDFF